MGKNDAKVKKALARSTMAREAKILLKRAAGAGSTKAVKALKRGAKISGFVGGKFTSGPQGPEIKKLDINVGQTNVGTAAPYVNGLFDTISQGTGVGNRIGDRIHMKAVDVQWNIQIDGAGLPTLNNAAFIDLFCIVDLQPDGGTASATTIFASPTTNLTYLNIDQLERFRVLKRERIYLDAASGLSDVRTWHVPLDLGVRYGTATSAPNTNDVLLCAVSPGAAGSENSALISYVARLSWTDE